MTGDRWAAGGGTAGDEAPRSLCLVIRDLAGDDPSAHARAAAELQSRRWCGRRPESACEALQTPPGEAQLREDIQELFALPASDGPALFRSLLARFVALHAQGLHRLFDRPRHWRRRAADPTNDSAGTAAGGSALEQFSILRLVLLAAGPAVPEVLPDLLATLTVKETAGPITSSLPAVLAEELLGRLGVAGAPAFMPLLKRYCTDDAPAALAALIRIASTNPACARQTLALAVTRGAEERLAAIAILGGNVASDAALRALRGLLGDPDLEIAAAAARSLYLRQALDAPTCAEVHAVRQRSRAAAQKAALGGDRDHSTKRLDFSFRGRPLVEWLHDLGAEDEECRLFAGEVLATMAVGWSELDTDAEGFFLDDSAARRFPEAVRAALQRPEFPLCDYASRLLEHLITCHRRAAGRGRLAATGADQNQTRGRVRRLSLAITIEQVLVLAGPAIACLAPTLTRHLAPAGRRRSRSMLPDALCHILGAMGPAAGPVAADPLMELLFRRFGRQYPEPAAGALVAVVGDGSAVVGRLALALSDRRPTARRGAAHLLGRLGPAARSTVPALVPMALGLPPGAAAEAAAALAQLSRHSPDAAAVMPELATATEVGVRLAVASALGRLLGDQLARQRLLALAADPSPMVRCEAVAALGTAGLADADIVQVLISALADQEAECDYDSPASAALAALERLGPAAAAAVPVLTDALRQSFTAEQVANEQTRQAAAEGGGVTWESAAPLNLASIARVLGRIGPAAAAVAPLLTAIRDWLAVRDPWGRDPRVEVIETALAGLRPEPPQGTVPAGP